ncbi:hypothetical protein GTY75_09080 [Streptomyces sp. SID8381]|uniref:hypothetical protein n=1 Tax=unclassified Streptomyces TaxID=2593676 RepID=UPI00037D5616|nr:MULTISPECIES: hypothetical protein [unclassified Streptomyces]MYX26820.1 hypothetical protein [Streptomyces sp. SID8381]
MSNPIDALAADALSSLTAAGFDAALIVRASDTMLIASVPDTRRQWATVALKPFTTLPLADAGGRARYAVFPEPQDSTPYSRTVYFRATGGGVPRRFVGRTLVDTVLITPGDTTEADIPKALALNVFGTLARTDDITVIRLA